MAVALLSVPAVALLLIALVSVEGWLDGDRVEGWLDPERLEQLAGSRRPVTNRRSP